MTTGSAASGPRAPGRSAPEAARRGGFVVSLDFELRWGLRDVVPTDGGSYRDNLVGARRAIPRILELFTRYDIAATWATVGFLFARDSDELQSFLPEARPRYVDPRYDPYPEVGRAAPDLHFAPELIDRIRETPRQEVGSHTFSHYYCLEEGHTRETFAADIAAAVRIARARGVTLRSLVLPRNQMNPAYAPVLAQAGIVAVRGNPCSWLYRAGSDAESRNPARRAARLVDSYVDITGDHLLAWSNVRRGPLCDVAASMFLRPATRIRGLELLRGQRIARAIESAARQRRIFHLWWHPHNFGVNLEDNLRFLDEVLACVARCRDAWGLQSLSMGEVASELGA